MNDSCVGNRSFLWTFQWDFYVHLQGDNKIYWSVYVGGNQMHHALWKPPKYYHHLQNTHSENLKIYNTCSGFVFLHFPRKDLKYEEKFVLCSAAVHRFPKYLGVTSNFCAPEGWHEGRPILCTPHVVHHVCSGRNSQCAVNRHRNERNVMLTLRNL